MSFIFDDFLDIYYFCLRIYYEILKVILKIIR